MKFVYFVLVLCFQITIFAQVQVQFRIYHKLGNVTFQLNQIAQNNLSQEYKSTRLQYYLTRFTLVHDGGVETVINEDTVALVTLNGNEFSSVDLGIININQPEKIKFHIGVYAPVNYENPSLYASDHPLSPKNPSMHWGWASGYRFLVYEGLGGTNFAQTFQLHGLDSANYFETTVDVSSQDVNGKKIIAVDGDYTRGLDSIDVSQGLFAHGVNRADLTMLENFRDVVFSPSSAVLAVEQTDFSDLWNIYPNPILSDQTSIHFTGNESDFTVLVTSITGDEIAKVQLSKNTTLELKQQGIYFVSIMKDNVIVDTKKIIKI